MSFHNGHPSARLHRMSRHTCHISDVFYSSHIFAGFQGRLNGTRGFSRSTVLIPQFKLMLQPCCRTGSTIVFLSATSTAAIPASTSFLASPSSDTIGAGMARIISTAMMPNCVQPKNDGTVLYDNQTSRDYSCAYHRLRSMGHLLQPKAQCMLSTQKNHSQSVEHRDVMVLWHISWLTWYDLVQRLPKPRSSSGLFAAIDWFWTA